MLYRQVCDILILFMNMYCNLNEIILKVMQCKLHFLAFNIYVGQHLDSATSVWHSFEDNRQVHA